MNKSFSEVKVLVVDDQPVIVEEVCEFLQGSGYRCVPCQSATQAIECFAADPAIGVVLCDLHMPQCDGLELFKSLKVVAGTEAPQHVARQGQEHDDGQCPAALAGIGTDPGVPGHEQVDQRAGCRTEGQGVGDLAFTYILFGAQGKPQQKDHALHWRKASLCGE